MYSNESGKHTHSALIRNLIKLKGTVKLTAQGERVCLKDSKYILFEILANRTWKGHTSSLLAEQALFSNSELVRLFYVWSSRISNKIYIWNPWGIPVHPAQLVLLYLSTLLDSWLVHCGRDSASIYERGGMELYFVLVYDMYFRAVLWTADDDGLCWPMAIGFY